MFHNTDMMTMSSSLISTSSTHILLPILLLLLSGDIETNPGHKEKGKKEKGQSVEDQINDLKTDIT